jgi:hypothetical protein
MRHFTLRYRDLRLERGRWCGPYRQLMPERLVGFWFRLPFSHAQHNVRLRKRLTYTSNAT